MQRLLPRSTALLEAAALKRRVSVWILVAALAAVFHGCSSISETPNRTASLRRGSLPEPRAHKPAIDKSQTHSIPLEIPSTAKIPSSPATEQPPPLETIPAPLQPTLLETGVASWYGPRFHGKLTASGEVFNQNELTAAHRTLPWGSKVKVINLTNGKSVEVRINDRGPFEKGRIIDVSRAAARALGMLKSGIAQVRIEWFSDSDTSNELALEHKRSQ
ncbi:MAG TPA: septal ring lytic transglycosylase RlpA family protein [Candidatus Binatia bacterium]|nr:septal ring lytic transglycosylase RlpA family protein [Candidatus Binatia bacterium]